MRLRYSVVLLFGLWRPRFRCLCMEKPTFRSVLYAVVRLREGWLLGYKTGSLAYTYVGAAASGKKTLGVGSSANLSFTLSLGKPVNAVPFLLCYERAAFLFFSFVCGCRCSHAKVYFGWLCRGRAKQSGVMRCQSGLGEPTYFNRCTTLLYSIANQTEISTYGEATFTLACGAMSVEPEKDTFTG